MGIVDSLFGPQPWEINRAENAQLGNSADRYASQDPFAKATGQLYRAGGMLARPAMESAGYVNPAVQEAQRTQAVMGMGGDVSTAQGLKAKAAQFAQAGDQQTAMKLIMLARQQEAQEQDIALKRAQELAQLHKANAEASPLAKLSPKDYTPESWGEYVKTSDTSKLRAIEKPQYESMSNEQKLVEAAADAKGLKADTPERAAFTSKAYEKLMDKKTHINVNAGVSGGEAPTKEEVDFYAEMAMSGDQSWRVGLGRSKDGVALIRAVDRRMPELAKEVGMKPGDVVANKQEVATRLKALRDFSTGTQGQMVTSFNTAIDHLDTLNNLGKALKNGDMQLANKIKNTAAEWTGDADITNLDTAKQIVGAEIIKAIVARGGGVQEREEAADRISRISSPAQLSGYIDTAQKLMAGQLKSLERQYEVNTARKDFKAKLLPRSKAVLESLSDDKTSPAKPAALVDQIPGAKATVSNW